MKLIYFFILGISSFLMDGQAKTMNSTCTCISYELKEQLVYAEVVSHAKVIKLDTVNLVYSLFGKKSELRKSLYEQKETMIKVTFVNKRILKGNLNSDTFSVISLNSCQYEFEDKYDYIVAANHIELCELEIVADSIKCNLINPLCTNVCYGNSIYYEGAEEKYLQLLK